MKTLFKILALVIIDFVLIWLWVYEMDPHPSESIGIIILVPFIFIINLVLAGILFLIKKKGYSKIFLANSIIASIIMFYLFEEGIDRHLNNRIEDWTFQKADTIFSLTRWKNTNDFSMTYSLNPGSSWSFLDGHYKLENGKWILETDSLKMKIDKKDNLIGFRNPTDTIQMEKIKR